MSLFEQGQVVRVPFPYTDRDKRQFRPALVVSDGAIGDNQSLLWVAMITSAENRAWANDCEIKDYRAAKLPIPSVVRPTKITTVEVADAQVVGRVDADVLGRVLKAITRSLGLIAA